jgi:hypothetical protein
MAGMRTLSVFAQGLIGVSIKKMLGMGNQNDSPTFKPNYSNHYIFVIN